MRNGPAYHGRTHSPGGTDPIPDLGGSGIQFDTYPQAGDWLYVETTNDVLYAPPLADQEELEARFPSANTGTFAASMLFLPTGSSSFTVYAPDAGQIKLIAEPADFGVITIDSYELNAGGTQVQISGGTGGVDIQATDGGGMTLASDFADLIIRVGNGGNVNLALGTAGEKVQVTDHLGASIFEIHEDGSVHGLASVGSMTWDL